MYYLYHGNLLAGHAELVESNCEYLLRHWRPEGIGWASTGLPESDDTAMVLLALGRIGYDVDGSCACSLTSAIGTSRSWNTNATLL
jgi:hypothetical protein